MPETEGSGGEGIEDGGVHGLVVLVAVPVGLGHYVTQGGGYLHNLDL